ncbi:MAG: hypothetical protein ABSG41_03925 [Bryobacteraceae bacterium]|jgi:hypothetical protein
MIRLSRLLVFASCVSGFAVVAPAADIKGVLMDQKCSGTADLRISSSTGSLVGGMIVAEAHTKECALMPECQKSGYGVYTSDNKFLKFDEEGNRKAIAAIKASTKIDDLEVEVTGEVKDNTIKVATLKLLPPHE